MTVWKEVKMYPFYKAVDSSLKNRYVALMSWPLHIWINTSDYRIYVDRKKYVSRHNRMVFCDCETCRKRLAAGEWE